MPGRLDPFARAPGPRHRIGRPEDLTPLPVPQNGVQALGRQPLAGPFLPGGVRPGSVSGQDLRHNVLALQPRPPGLAQQMQAAGAVLTLRSHWPGHADSVQGSADGEGSHQRAHERQAEPGSDRQRLHRR
jgi:hypothetical protein